MSNSSALMAEAIHSLVDIFNQYFLRVGIMHSRKAPTAQHPYGYMRDKFVFSLISAVGIFCMGAGVTLVNGIHALSVGGHVENMMAGLAVLGLSLILETYSLMVAVRTVAAGAEAARMSFLDYVRRANDPTSIAVMMEDSAAVAGLVVAGVCTWLVHHTGNVVWDAVGSLAVSVLLGAVAVFLIQQNRQLLIGRSMQQEDLERVMEYLRNDPVVKAVYDAKSEEIGNQIYRFKAEIAFAGDEIVRRHLERTGREVLYSQIDHAMWTKDTQAIDRVLSNYGQDVVSAVGAEVDRIEGEIQRLCPNVRYVDLETDRGVKMERTGWEECVGEVKPTLGVLQ